MTRTESDRWVWRQKPNPRARMRLFCFPYAGGGAAAYRGWTDELPGQLEVCVIQLPGRESRFNEPPYTDAGRLLNALVPALEPLLDLPFALFGHSMGALTAFELSRELRRRALPGPAHLFVSGRWAPQLVRENEEIHRLPESAFIEQLRVRYNGIPQQILQEPELMRLFIPVLRADFTLLETWRYVPEPPLDCSISAFGGLRDDRAAHADIAPWREQTRGAFSLQMFPGDHFFVQSSRRQLLEVLHDELSHLIP